MPGFRNARPQGSGNPHRRPCSQRIWNLQGPLWMWLNSSDCWAAGWLSVSGRESLISPVQPDALPWVNQLRLGRQSDKKSWRTRAGAGSQTHHWGSGSRVPVGRSVCSTSPPPCLELQGKVRGGKPRACSLVEKGILGNKRRNTQNTHFVTRVCNSKDVHIYIYIYIYIKQKYYTQLENLPFFTGCYNVNLFLFIRSMHAQSYPTLLQTCGL